MDLDNLKLPCKQAWQMLPESERKKSERFRFEILRTRYTKGHYLLRALLGGYLGIDFYNQEFHVNKYGKPSLKNSQTEDPIHFNMSHSENACICVFKQHDNIGVDIEKIHNLSEMDDIAKRFFSHDEKEMFYSLPEHDRKATFFKYWARKEATLKAMGVGLSFSPEQVNVLSDQKNDESGVFIKTNEMNSERKWTLYDISVFDGFASALAHERKRYDDTPELLYFRLDQQHLRQQFQ